MKINIYMCGPTLFDYVHFGCYRIFVLADIIDKHFKNKGYVVNHGFNIMDIDDKIIDFYKENKYFDVNVFYTSLKKEFNYLKLNYPNFETKTTGYIESIKKLIKHYLDRDLAYVSNSGIYLDLSKICNYGELSHIDVDKNLKNHNTDDKKNPCDPSLWRFLDSKFSYDFLEKKGRPGWDIQCANCCILNMNSDIDYQFAGFNDVTHYENNKVLIENSYNYSGYKSKWFLTKYVNFVDDSPYFYMRDYIKNYNRHVIKYALYSMSYSSQFNLTNLYFNNCIKDIEKLNNFYNKIKGLNEFASTNIEINNILEKFNNIDELIENLKISLILGLIFKLIRGLNKNNFCISAIQKEKIIKIFDYLNERLDFLI